MKTVMVKTKMLDGREVDVTFDDLGKIRVCSDGVTREMYAAKFTIGDANTLVMHDAYVADCEGPADQVRMKLDMDFLEGEGVDGVHFTDMLATLDG